MRSDELQAAWEFVTPILEAWHNTPPPPRNEPYKTHLAYVKERRSDADGEAILTEALQQLRGRGLIR